MGNINESQYFHSISNAHSLSLGWLRKHCMNIHDNHRDQSVGLLQWPMGGSIIKTNKATSIRSFLFKAYTEKHIQQKQIHSVAVIPETIRRKYRFPSAPSVITKQYHRTYNFYNSGGSDRPQNHPYPMNSTQFKFTKYLAHGGWGTLLQRP